MVRSLWTAATGMNGQQSNIDAISNNLSNVNVVNEMVQMIEVNRAYEANQKTITSEDSMMGTLWTKTAVFNR